MEGPPIKRPVLPLANEGQLYGHFGRHAGMMVMTAFEMIGGIERLADWAAKNPEKFYTKIFAKMVARPVQVEVGASEDLEKVIRDMDAKTIEGTVVHDIDPSAE